MEMHDHSDHLNYTKDEIKKNLILLEGHGKNYPCPECIEKHLLNVEGLSEEGITMAENPEERNNFIGLAEMARNARRKMQEAI